MILMLFYCPILLLLEKFKMHLKKTFTALCLPIFGFKGTEVCWFFSWTVKPEGAALSGKLFSSRGRVKFN